MDFIRIDPEEIYVKRQIRIQTVVAEKSALKSAYKQASSVEVVGGANEKACSCSRSAVRLSARVRREYASGFAELFSLNAVFTCGVSTEKYRPHNIKAFDMSVIVPYL